MSKRPMYLQHVNIYVRNAERSKQWYEDLLGLHTYEYRPGWAAFMSADEEQSHEVALMQLGDDAPLQQKGQVGLNHMAWRLESLDDLKEFYQRIKSKGIKPEHISDHGISLGIYLRDPDGNGVEVFYEMPRAEWGGRLPHLLARQDRPRPLPGPVGRRDPRRRRAGGAARRRGIARNVQRHSGAARRAEPGTHEHRRRTGLYGLLKSVAAGCVHGFRAPSLRSGPGMTVFGFHSGHPNAIR